MKCSYCDQKYDPLKARTAFCNHFNCPETVWKNGFEKKQSASNAQKYCRIYYLRTWCSTSNTWLKINKRYVISEIRKDHGKAFIQDVLEKEPAGYPPPALPLFVITFPIKEKPIKTILIILITFTK